MKRMKRMKRTLSIVCVATITSTAALLAQTGSMGKTEPKKMVKDGTEIVTGCLADKNSAGHYILNNAMMSGPTATAGMSGGAMAEKDKGMAGDHKMMAYELSGGGDLKKHIGHKMEVTGTVDNSSMEKATNKTGKMDQMGDMNKDKMGKDQMATGHDMGMRLKVKSVRMLSDTCS